MKIKSHPREAGFKTSQCKYAIFTDNINHRYLFLLWQYDYTKHDTVNVVWADRKARKIREVERRQGLELNNSILQKGWKQLTRLKWPCMHSFEMTSKQAFLGPQLSLSLLASTRHKLLDALQQIGLLSRSCSTLQEPRTPCLRTNNLNLATYSRMFNKRRATKNSKRQVKNRTSPTSRSYRKPIINHTILVQNVVRLTCLDHHRSSQYSGQYSLFPSRYQKSYH